MFLVSCTSTTKTWKIMALHKPTSQGTLELDWLTFSMLSAAIRLHTVHVLLLFFFTKKILYDFATFMVNVIATWGKDTDSQLYCLPHQTIKWVFHLFSFSLFYCTVASTYPPTNPVMPKIYCQHFCTFVVLQKQLAHYCMVQYRYTTVATGRIRFKEKI